MNDHPRAKPREVKPKFKGEKASSIETYIKQWRKKSRDIPKKKVISPKKKVIEKVQDNPPPLNRVYTDDPDELLMSVAIRELNKPQPDPRWASILINCKKENITTKSEVLEEFKQLPTQVLVNLLSKSLQKES